MLYDVCKYKYVRVCRFEVNMKIKKKTYEILNFCFLSWHNNTYNCNFIHWHLSSFNLDSNNVLIFIYVIYRVHTHTHIVYTYTGIKKKIKWIFKHKNGSPFDIRTFFDSSCASFFLFTPPSWHFVFIKLRRVFVFEFLLIFNTTARVSAVLPSIRAAGGCQRIASPFWSFCVIFNLGHAEALYYLISLFSDS